MTSPLLPYRERMERNPEIAPEVLDFLFSEKEKFLFGAGTQAAVCLAVFRDMGLPVAGLLLDAAGEKERLQGYWGRLLRRQPLYRIDDFPFAHDACGVLLTVPSALYAAAGRRLRDAGFRHVCGCAWGSNMNLKNICLEVYAARIAGKGDAFL